jgi:hypothetical protein
VPTNAVRKIPGPKVKAKAKTKAKAKARAKAPAKKSNPVGRPTSYRPEYCTTVVHLGIEGKSYAAIANELGTTRETLYTWMEKHPEFLDAMKRSRLAAMQWWEDTLMDQARGRVIGGSTTAAIVAMKNQFPDDYKDRREVDVSGQLKVVTVDFVGFEEDAIDVEYEEIP